MTDHIVIADSSPLIAFGRINQISLLSNVLGHIIIPDAVARECLIELAKPGAKAIRHAIDEKSITVYQDPDVNEYNDLLDILDKGEAVAITLADKLHAKLLIDERLGRHVAKEKHITIIGTAGVILLAKQKNKIKKVLPLINELKKAGYYLSEDLIKSVLQRADE